MPPLSRDQILARRASLPTEAVEVSELGGSVTIRVLTLAEVQEIQKFQRTNSDPLDLYPKIVAMATVDDTGAQMFVGEDINLVVGLPWPATDTIARAVLKLNKMTTDDSGPKA